MPVHIQTARPLSDLSPVGTDVESSTRFRVVFAMSNAIASLDLETCMRAHRLDPKGRENGGRRESFVAVYKHACSSCLFHLLDDDA
jgi:hypothetical protein